MTRFPPPFPESSSALRVLLQTTHSTLLPPHAFMHFPIKFPPREGERHSEAISISNYANASGS